MLSKVQKPASATKRQDYLVLPLVFVILTCLVVYIALSPIVKPYLGLAQMLFKEPAATATDRFAGAVDNLATGGTLQFGVADYPIFGDKVGEISIENTSVDAPLYYGDGTTQLNQGVGIYNGAGIPGQSQTILLAGHSGTFFKGLQDVQPGDEVRVTTYYGEYRYRVTEAKVLDASDSTAYDFTRSDENLILYTCYPFDQFGYTPQRYFVYAEYVSGPMIQQKQ